VTRHFRTDLDLEREELARVLDRAAFLKRVRGTDEHPSPLARKSVALIFEKASTRTRVSFEVGVAELGGQPVSIIAKDSHLVRGEPLADTARMLSRYVHAIMVRTFGHDRIEELARHASVPVINGLCDDYHPCQLLADLMTVQEHVGRDLSKVRVAWIGDGNNVAHSWILCAARTGLSFRLACPEGYEPKKEIVARAKELGADVEVLRDPREAAKGADVVTTDVWASMGQEGENEIRRAAFSAYQVDAAIMSAAASSAIFLHCLPAHRGEEVAAEVIDGPASRVWDEAENRLHAQKALLELLVGKPR
jgi:ornithine carbamoyltransferase